MQTTFEQLRSHLTDGVDHRLWSLLVTVFGDLAPNQDDRISGVLLNQITAAVGLKPEATRVALHRLRKDDWIESHKQGRQSDHRLTKKGRAETQAARPRVYSQKGISTECRLLIRAPDTQIAQNTETLVWLNSDLALSTVRTVPDGMSACTPPDPLPTWMQTKIADPHLGAILTETEHRFRSLLMTLPQANALSTFERAVLRCLAVHTWRRIALKLPALPDSAFPTGWPAAECRALVAALLELLPKPTIGALEQSRPETVRT